MASPLGQGGTSGGLGVTHNLVWVVDRGTHPGASRPLSLRRHPSDAEDLQRTLLEKFSCGTNKS